MFFCCNIISQSFHFHSRRIGMIWGESVDGTDDCWVFRVFCSSAAPPLRHETFEIFIIRCAENGAVRVFDLLFPRQIRRFRSTKLCWQSIFIISRTDKGLKLIRSKRSSFINSKNFNRNQNPNGNLNLHRDRNLNPNQRWLFCGISHPTKKNLNPMGKKSHGIFSKSMG